MSIEVLQPYDGCLPEQQRIPLDRLLDGRKTILVAEADVALLEAMAYVLRWAGYEILIAHSSLEAVSICKRYSVTIDLILYDLNLPGENGADLAEKVAALRRNLPMIFLSGNPIASRTLWAKGCTVLEKPFSLAEMTFLVREILGTAPNVTILSKPVAKWSMQ